MAPGVTVSDANAELVAEGDLDNLVRHVDRLCRAEAWEDLEDLRHRCRAALERGHQLWPIASLAEYRLALLAPPRWAAGVLADGAGLWALGPLPEVTASTHRFAELAPHLTPGPAASTFAHECAARGEDLTADVVRGDVERLAHDEGVPLRLGGWEPRYPVATYHPDRAEFAGPGLPPTSAFRPLPAATPDPLTSDDAAAALRELVEGWSGEPGTTVRTRVAAVDGPAESAVCAVAPGARHWARVQPAEAMALMAWAAASGGHTGRRRGLARGRFDAWWAVAALGGCEQDWPLDPEEVASVAEGLTWWVFDDAEALTGWHLRLAVADPIDALAWAVNASVTAAP